MHRLVEDQLEEVLAGTLPAGHEVVGHLKTCVECREETDAMRAQNQVLRAFKYTGDVEPRPGFYARVLERIEAQRPVSIWALFTESSFGRRLATASLALAMFTVAYVVSVEQAQPSYAAAAQVEMDPLYPAAGFGEDVMAANGSDSAVFMSLVSYQGR